MNNTSDYAKPSVRSLILIELDAVARDLAHNAKMFGELTMFHKAYFHNL